MKKIVIFFFLLIVVGVTALAGCSGRPDQTVTVFMTDGAPALAVSKLLHDNYQGSREIIYEIKTVPTALSSGIISNEADIVLMPTNMASTLYNTGGQNVILLSTVIQGSLYMVTTDGKTFNDVQQLVGEVVVNIGRGQTPDILFKYILEQNDIEYVESEEPVTGKVALTFVDQPPKAIAALATGDYKFAILGEPQVTMSHGATGAVVAFDLQELWRQAEDSDTNYPQVSVVARREFYNNNRTFINNFISQLQSSAQWTNENPEAAGLAVQAAGSGLQLAFTADLIQRCNIEFKSAQQSKQAVESYLSALHAFNPATIGGSLPDDDFYHND